MLSLWGTFSSPKAEAGTPKYSPVSVLSLHHHPLATPLPFPGD